MIMKKQQLQRIAFRTVVAALAIGAAATASATATGPDLSSLTTAISFDTVITAVLAISATAAGLYLAIKGAKIVLRMIRSS